MGSTSEKTEQDRVVGEIPAEERLSPAVSVVADEMDIGTVARVVLRANEHDVFTFVVVPDDDSLIGTLAEKLGAVVLESDFSDDDSRFETVERVA